MTQTELTLNESQQQVVDRLRALPGAHSVTIKSWIFVDSNGHTHSAMEIYGGADGPEPIKCPTCSHRPGASFISMTFMWSNNKYNKTRISVNYGAKRRPPRGRVGMARGLDFMERFVMEEFQPTMKGLK